MFCSTQFLLKRCYLLYMFIAVAILLLLFCIYLYRKYTKQNKLENIEVNRMNLEEETEEFNKVMDNEYIEEPSDNIGNSEENINVEVSEDIKIDENEAREIPGLIRKPFKNDEENQKVKENERKNENGENESE